MNQDELAQKANDLARSNTGLRISSPLQHVVPFYDPKNRQEIRLPFTPKELIEELNKRFPNDVPDRRMSRDDPGLVDYIQGQRSVVDFLIHKLIKQEE